MRANQPMAEGEGAAPRVAHGFLHIGCSPLEIRDGRVNAALAGLANHIVGDGVPRHNVQHRNEYVF